MEPEYLSFPFCVRATPDRFNHGVFTNVAYILAPPRWLQQETSTPSCLAKPEKLLINDRQMQFLVDATRFLAMRYSLPFTVIISSDVIKSVTDEVPISAHCRHIANGSSSANDEEKSVATPICHLKLYCVCYSFQFLVGSAVRPAIGTSSAASIHDDRNAIAFLYFLPSQNRVFFHSAIFRFVMQLTAPPTPLLFLFSNFITVSLIINNKPKLIKATEQCGRTWGHFIDVHLAVSFVCSEWDAVAEIMHGENGNASAGLVYLWCRIPKTGFTYLLLFLSFLRSHFETLCFCVSNHHPSTVRFPSPAIIVCYYHLPAMTLLVAASDCWFVGALVLPALPPRCLRSLVSCVLPNGIIHEQIRCQDKKKKKNFHTGNAHASMIETDTASHYDCVLLREH